jgi:hypothetical protein
VLKHYHPNKYCWDVVVTTGKSQLVVSLISTFVRFLTRVLTPVKRRGQGSSIGGTCAGYPLRRWSIYLLLGLQAERNDSRILLVGVWRDKDCTTTHSVGRYCWFLLFPTVLRKNNSEQLLAPTRRSELEDICICGIHSTSNRIGRCPRCEFKHTSS